MELLFKCLQQGNRYYSVRLNGQEIFVGTTGECERFMAIHNAKAEQEQVDNQRTPRNRPVSIRTYRHLRNPA